ncbi:PRC-barrel domain-containing protein [Ferrovibrio sp.]|uniref:PRC-barrel domain-containing protein n=1 Tax=Ferrovibrio sp. TaxID=1917215 RepID=UPI0035B3C76F
MTKQRRVLPRIAAIAIAASAIFALSNIAAAQHLMLAQAQAPKQEEPAPRQPRAAVPGPNAVPGIPEGEKSKAPDYSVDKNMPDHNPVRVAIIGQPLRDTQGTKLGNIVNLIVDPDGKILAVIIGIDRLFGLTEEQVEMEWRHLRLERHDKDAAFITDLSTDELRKLPKAGQSRSG